MNKTLLQYARLLIKMPLDSMFPDHIEFINDNGILRAIQRMNPQSEGTAHEQPKEIPGPDADPQLEGFTLVAKKDAARDTPEPVQAERRPGQQNNSFQIAWKPNIYNVELLEMTEQMIHCYVTQLHTSKKFYISFIYGLNHESQRHVLWQYLTEIAAHMNSAWCIIGDFNSVLYKEDRIGGEEIKDHEIKDFAECLEACEMNETRSTGAYYSWTNKTI
ncbi:hypothetical protein Cgig2_029230 [Carnegiea gigantea]|uniref:Uncharacterized protein n=1 Tax=Carnegiea gigantea TaxID=171969 RepID=A0A9Q1JLW7_9CARY|nr:hypothetical protein Cgig2_029230 [Carnegiea gigantea]